MAVTIKTAQFGRDTCPQAQFTVDVKSSDGDSIEYSWELKWVTHGYTVSSSQSKAYTAKIDGVTVASGSFAIGGKTTQVIKSGTYTINRGTSSRTVPMSLSFDMTFTWSGTSGGTKTASGSFTIGAKTSYTISYNANGGSGAPSAQTKWYGTNLTLSSSTPSRTGHNFVRWNTNTSNTGTAYSPGGTYTANAAATLYAIWTPHTYTVQYNANGGTGAPGNQTKTYGTNLTLTTAKPTRTNYNFKGWSTSANGGVVYAAGATYTNNSAVTLYAVWELAYQKPRISNFTANRCTSDGTVSETGTYIKLNFSWATDRTVSSIYVQYKLQSAGSWISGLLTYSGTTSGTVTQAIGLGNISIESSYHVRVYVTDSGGTTYSSTISIGTVKFPIDIKAGGTGVAIGKVAEKDAFEVGMDQYSYGDIHVHRSEANSRYFAKRTDTGTEVWMGVGAGGINHGLWSTNLNKWIAYADDSNVYLNGNASTASRSNKPKSYSSGSDSGGTSGWYLIASKNMNGDWEDVSATLLVTQQYEQSHVGILRIKCRRDQGDARFQGLRWINRYGWNESDAIGIVSGTNISVYIYTNLSQYGRIGVTVLEDAYRGGNGNLTIHNSTSPTTGLSASIWASDGCVVQNAKSITADSNGAKSHIQLGSLKICWGKVSITPVANTATKTNVVFPLTYSKTPTILVSPHTGAPGSSVLGAGATNMTTTNFDIFVYRTNTTATGVMWFAIGE